MTVGQSVSKRVMFVVRSLHIMDFCLVVDDHKFGHGDSIGKMMYFLFAKTLSNA